MTTIKAIVRGGRLEVEEPIDLPDGTEVDISVRETDTLMSPEEIERVRAAMDQMIPFVMSDEELAAWEAERQERKEWEKARFFDRAESIRRMIDGEIPPR